MRAVDGISYTVEQGETVAIVGESGSGKSVGALSILRLIPDPPGRITAGEILFDGRDLRGLPKRRCAQVRGRDIGMVFQEPMTSLNPVLTIGRQITETLEQHQGADRADGRPARDRAAGDWSASPIPSGACEQYPHQLSGGMRQRVMIAIALACDPKLIIADEPTTALDVTIQAQILELMKSLTRRLNVALIIITHNLGVVARYASRVNVMYAGRIVESGSADAIYHDPRHPYTMALLRSVPRLDRPRQARLDPVEGQPPDLTRLDGGCAFRPRCRFAVDALRRGAAAAASRPARRASCRLLPQPTSSLRQRRHARHERRRATARRAAARGARARTCTSRSPRGSCAPQDRRREGGRRRRLHDRRGETLGLVGESGCGKTTTGRCILRLETSDRGRDPVRRARHQPHGAQGADGVAPPHAGDLPGPLQLAQSAHEGGRHHRRADQGARRRARCRRGARDGCASCCRCAASIPKFTDRYPHEMSGGQRQRVGIARALALDPEFIVCDEAVSALDVSIQAQVINLLEDLRERFGLTYLFIAHDLSVVRHLCQRVAVMYLGRIVEMAESDELFDNPLHPYTQALLSAVPVPDPRDRGDARVPAGAGRGAKPDQPAVRLRLPSALPDGGRGLQAGAARAAGAAPGPLGGLQRGAVASTRSVSKRTRNDERRRR